MWGNRVIVDSQLSVECEDFVREESNSPNPVSPPSPRREPDLEALIVEIRQDASGDSIHYLIRSNTNHDGE